MSLLTLFHFLLYMSFNAYTDAELVRWGFEAPFGGAVIHGRYDLTAEYLSNITGATVEVVPLIDDLELATAAGNGSLQMLQTGSGVYTCVEAKYGFVPLLNTLEPHAGRNITTVAGIIYARADDDSVNSIFDIKGKAVATGPFLYLSTFQSQWSYLKENNVDFFSEASAVLIATNPSTAVTDVASGKYPIGWTRAGLPEDMQAAGTLKQGLLKILNVKNYSDFPYATTTKQYPGNKISVSPNMSTGLQRALLSAFLTIPSPVASVGQYSQYVPSLPTTETLNMQNNIGLMQFPLKGCSSLTNAFAAVTCPVGYTKSSETSVMDNCKLQGVDCPVNYTCYCRPCFKNRTKQIGSLTKTQFIICLTVISTFFLLILILAASAIWALQSNLTSLLDFVQDSPCGLSALGTVYSGRFDGQSVVCKTVYRMPQGRVLPTALSCLLDSIVLRYKASLVTRRLPNDNENHICHVSSCGIRDRTVVILIPLVTLGSLSDLLNNPTVELPLSLTLRFMEALFLIIQRFHHLTPAKFGQTYDTGDLFISHEHGLLYSPGCYFFFSQLATNETNKKPYVTAPEVVLGQPISEQSDMWTAGLILYEILHRRPAFDDLEVDDVIMSMKKGDVRLPIIQQMHDVDALYDILRSCLERDPAQRPALTDCLHQIQQIATVIPRSELPPHLVSAMQGDKVVTTDVYKMVSLLCCEIDDVNVYDYMTEVAITKGLSLIPTAEHFKQCFVVAETLSEESEGTPQVYKLLDFLREVSIKHELLSFGLHCGDLRGTIIGDRYSFVGPTMAALRALQDFARGGEILCSEQALSAKGILNVELSPRAGMIKCRGQVPFRAMYAKLR